MDKVVQHDYSIIKGHTKSMTQVDEEQWLGFQNLLQYRKFKKGDYLLRAGDVCDFVAFVNNGAFRTYMIIQGEDITTGFSHVGMYVTDYCSFIARSPALENIVCEEDGETFFLYYADMQRLFREFPVYERFGRLIAEFLFVWVNNRKNDLILKTPEENYLNLMKERPLVFQLFRQKDIASYLGLKPQSLSRIRKRLHSKK